MIIYRARYRKPSVFSIPRSCGTQGIRRHLAEITRLMCEYHETLPEAFAEVIAHDHS